MKFKFNKTAVPALVASIMLGICGVIAFYAIGLRTSIDGTNSVAKLLSLRDATEMKSFNIYALGLAGIIIAFGMSLISFISLFTDEDGSTPFLLSIVVLVGGVIAAILMYVSYSIWLGQVQSSLDLLNKQEHFGNYKKSTINIGAEAGFYIMVSIGLISQFVCSVIVCVRYNSSLPEEITEDKERNKRSFNN